MRHDGVAEGGDTSGAGGAARPAHGSGRFPNSGRVSGSAGPSVQPSGNPISASTHAGFRMPRPSPGHPLLLDPYSLAVGVGHSRIASVRLLPGCMTPVVVVPRAELRASVVTGVGHEEEPLATMRRADVGGGDDATLHAIPGGVEVGNNSVQPARNECRNVLDDDRAGSQFFDDAEVLAPEAGARAVEAGVSPGNADVLAWESTTNHLHGLQVVGADVAHVRVTLRVWPMHGEHAAAPRVKLDLPRDRPEPSPLKAKLQPADAREQGAYHESVHAEHRAFGVHIPMGHSSRAWMMRFARSHEGQRPSSLRPCSSPHRQHGGRETVRVKKVSVRLLMPVRRKPRPSIQTFLKILVPTVRPPGAPLAKTPVRRFPTLENMP